MRKNRIERRRARVAVLGQVATAASFQPINKRRASRTARSRVRGAMMAASILAVVMFGLFATPKVAKAALPIDVPEIDPSSMAGALTLLAGGALMITGRTRHA